MYDVSPDGKRFVVVTSGPGVNRLVVVLDAPRDEVTAASAGRAQ